MGKELGVEIRCGQRVEKLVVENDEIRGVKSNGEVIEGSKVILATGGKSYPATGAMAMDTNWPGRLAILLKNQFRLWFHWKQKEVWRKNYKG